MFYIGIDNGSSGAIATIDDTGAVMFVRPMPPTDVEVLTYLQIIRGAPSDGQVRCVLEHAQAFPKMGVSSAFNYGKGYGAMQMALAAAGIRFDIVVPRKWQAALSCLSAGDKNVTKRRAEQLFPGTKITHAIADAMLMAEYCRRIHRGPDHGKATEAGTEAKGGGAEEQKAPGEGARPAKARRKNQVSA